ncbi:MAG: PKD domain-containing protein, partial [Candidatus Bathyarchaeota archaeon]|nr:PKD domain-containing protein [Candidatus Bathyarchaeota archaeon]
EDLIAHNQTTVDPDGDDVTNIYHWYINNVSTTNLLMPFDTDSPTTVIDYSGYDNHGEFYSPPATWTEDGVVGGAYYFDGNNFVVISDDPSLVGDNNWNEISVEFWIKPAAELNRIRLIAKKEASASTGSYMVGFQSSGTPNTLFWGINSTVDNEWTDVYSEDTTVLEVDTWYHIVCTYKEGPGLTIYINGIQRVNKPLTGSIGRGIGDEPLFVGSSGEFDRSRWLNGTLDEVRIYPKALTPEQIFKRYMETKDGLSSSSTIVAQETTAGEEWKCEVIPNDSWKDGISKTSETLEVLSETGNSAPKIDMFTPEETTLEIDAGESLEFTHVSSDADGDPLTYLWLLDDVEKATTQNWTYSPGYDDAGIRNITLIVSDDEGLIDSQEWTVTVVDTRAHDVAIAVVTPCKTIVGQGLTMSINVTVTNKGNFTEAFNVTTYANTTAIQTLNVTNLPPGNSTTIIFTWNTTAFSKGSYTTSANATTVLGETDISDNGYIDGTVRVNIVGDLNSDRKVSITDIVIVALTFGSQPGDPKWNPNTDMNNDGKITITDVIIVKIHMGEKDT